MSKKSSPDLAPKGDPEKEHPKGTLAITLMYMVTIIILWSWVYQTLLERGVTR